MQNIMLLSLLLIVPGAKRTPITQGSRTVIHKKDITLNTYDPSKKPAFFYLREIKESDIRKHLKLTSRFKMKKASIGKLDRRERAFEKGNVSYAEILANLRTLEEWKATQQKIRRGEAKNVQMAKLQMEENVRKTRINLVKQFGTPEEYRAELEAYKKFEEFKTKFLKNKEALR